MGEFSNAETKIKKGKILIYRIFDLADEIDLSLAEKTLKAESAQRRVRLVRGPRQGLVIRNAPVRVHLGETPLTILPHLDKCLQSSLATVTATFWDYGVSSILFELTINEGCTWRDLLELSSDLMGNNDRVDEIDLLGRKKNEELAELIKGSLKNPETRQIFEDYIIYYLEEVEGVTKGTDLLQNVDVVALIYGEFQEKLANRSRQEVLDHALQYAENDLCVIDWNSAVVLEPTGQRDIADILEFSLTHLLELRFFDDVLDNRLSELYDALENRKQEIGLSLGFRGKFAGIAKDANSRFIEFSEFIERVDNSLKVVGDFYLAVIFRAAIKRFRVSDWHQSVSRKINILARVSELLQGEINIHRGWLLEIIIIVLIGFEIISAIVRN